MTPVHAFAEAADRRRAEQVAYMKCVFGTSKAMQKVRDRLSRVACSNCTLLITGETGTGKSLLTRYLHSISDRGNRILVEANCSNFTPELLASELFGHVKGSFTSAYCDNEGLVRSARDGVLFLDEIGDLPLNLQPRILHLLEEGRIRKVGSNKDDEIQCRIIAATNQNLHDLISQGRFREDLYYRLSVVTIDVPPLREHPEDIPSLIDYFLCKYSGQVPKEITDDAMQYLLAYPWPGNVRQLAHAIQRAILLSNGHPEIHVCDLELPEVAAKPADRSRVKKDIRDILDTFEFPDGGLHMEETLNDYRRRLIMLALSKSGGVQKKAAAMLGVTERVFTYQMQRQGLARRDFK